MDGGGNQVSSSYSDYWGTLVSSFDIQAPHHELSVTARSVVETGLRPRRLSRSAGPGCARSPRGAFGVLVAHPRTTVDAELAAAAKERAAARIR